MNYPKSVLLLHRKNMEWYNKKFVPFMRKKYSCTFTIICNSKPEEFRKKTWVSDEDFLIDISQINEDASILSKSETDIFSEARQYENKYNITYFRDAFLQDRSISVKILDSYSKHPTSRGDKLRIVDLTNKQNYFFDFFENHINKFKFDLMICRPDDMCGFAVITIASYLKIPITVQQTTRVNGYMYWQVGPYCHYKQIEHVAQKLKNNNLILEEKETTNIAGHAVKYNEAYLKKLSFWAMIDGVTYTLKDRLNWLIKDIKRGKIGKRIPMIPKILSKIFTYIDHKYYQRVFESDLANIYKRPFIFFPLPMEPEYATHSLSKNFNNVQAMIQQAAICMPSGYNLVIKEHAPNIGLKPRSFYKALMKMPNIIVANYFINGTELVEKAESVMTLVGSSALEAAERGKMAMLWGDSVEYIYLPNVLLIRSMQDLPEIIKKSLEDISENKKQEIKNEYKFYKDAFIESGYYAPNTPLFSGNSQEIKDGEFKRSIDKLLEVWRLQN